MMQPAVYEQHLSKVFDIQRGCQKLACKSRLPLPEDLRRPRSPEEQPFCSKLLQTDTGTCSLYCLFCCLIVFASARSSTADGLVYTPH